jgi:uncharacterized protein (TIGR00297 family)
MILVIGFCAALFADSLWRVGLHEYFFKVTALALCLGFVIWLMRAGTIGAASVGTLFAACLVAAPDGASGSIIFNSALPGLLTLFVLTTAATRFRKTDKARLGLAESSKGRSAAQIVANVGAAAMFASIAGAARNTALHAAMLAGIAASLAEATADTLASELGETLQGRVVLITTWKTVPAGTDGGISIKGTAAGIAGAIIVVLVCALTMRLSLPAAAAALTAALIGFFIDSFLGATLELHGYLSNNGVNFLSTLAAALIAAALVFR